MRKLLTTIILIALFGAISSLTAQREITGIVYNNGQPAAGVTNTAQKVNSSILTGFDGSYKIEITSKTKWIKYELPDGQNQKIEDLSKDQIDIIFGTAPVNIGTEEKGVDLRPAEKLTGEPEFTLNMTLYDDARRGKKYKEAYKPWSIVYKKYPKSIKNIYLHGTEIIGYIIESETDAKIKNAYIDTLMQIYDKRIKYFGEEGAVIGRKGVDLLKYRKEDVAQAYKFLSKSVELEKTNAEQAVLLTLMQSATRLYKLGEMEAGAIVDHFSQIIEILDKQWIKVTDQAERDRIRIAMKGVETLFSESGAANCKALIEIFKPKFDANPDDIDLLKKITKYLDRSECTDTTDLFTDASIKLYELEPSASAAYNIAKTHYKKGEYNQAIEFYKKAIDMYSKEEGSQVQDGLARANLELAATYLKQNQLSSVRSAALEALKYDPNMGKAYLLIATAYATSSKQCANSDNLDAKGVYWVAVDKCQKAKSVDPSIENEANSLINSFSAHFPNNEDAFFFGYTDGQTYKVGCWINETTTVRTRKR